MHIGFRLFFGVGIGLAYGFTFNVLGFGVLGATVAGFVFGTLMFGVLTLAYPRD